MALCERILGRVQLKWEVDCQHLLLQMVAPQGRDRVVGHGEVVGDIVVAFVPCQPPNCALAATRQYTVVQYQFTALHMYVYTTVCASNTHTTMQTVLPFQCHLLLL